MIITQSQDRMVVHSLQLIKTYMSLIFISVGLICLIVTPENGRSAGMFLAGFAFLFSGAFLASDIQYIYVVLDRSGPCKVDIKKLFRTYPTTFAFKDVMAVRQKAYVGIGNGSSGPNDILQLRIKKIGLVTIAATRQRYLTRLILRPYHRSGKKIASFIRVPFEIKTIDPLKGFVGKKKKS